MFWGWSGVKFFYFSLALFLISTSNIIFVSSETYDTYERDTSWDPAKTQFNAKQTHKDEKRMNFPETKEKTKTGSELLSPRILSRRLVGCNKGKYMRGNLQDPQCKPCQPGRYRPNLNHVFLYCIKCDTGKHAPSLGSDNIDDCEECGGGTYADETGLRYCKICPRGKYSTANADQRTSESVCIPCDAGKYSTAGGGETDPAVCIPCDAGKYSVEGSGRSTAVVCRSCEAGKYSDSGEAQSSYICKPCVAGKYSDSGPSQTSDNICKDCVAGKYSSEESRTSPAVCTPCDAGKYSTEGPAQSSDSTCKNCDAGKFSPVIAANSMSVCKDCEPNTYGPDPGRVSCIDCPGTEAAGATSCDGCAPGTYLAKDADCNDGNCCITCPEGYEALNVQSESCDQCRSGKFGKELGMGNTPAYQCVSCDEGKWSSEIGATSVSVCISCSAGKFSEILGADTIDSCEPCSPGRYSGQLASSLCQPCVNGKFAPAASATSCINCPGGWKQPSDSMAECIVCRNGFYQMEEGKDICDTCVAGFFSDSERATSCKGCGIGQFQSSQGETSCEKPPAGFYADEQNGTITMPCQSGKYGRLQESDRVSCDVCPAGFHQPNPMSIDCLQCDEGKYQNEESSTFCYPCPAGKHGSVDRKYCDGCPIGFHQPESGVTFCSSCKEGTYQNKENQTYCLACSAGQYQQEEGKEDCNLCEINTINNRPKSVSCHTCAIGKNALKKGSTSCVNCPAGFYNNINTPSGFCAKCPADMIRADFHDPTSCVNCEVGKIPNFHHTSCEPPHWGSCSPGTQYLHDFPSDDKSKWKCENCPTGGDCSGIRTWAQVVGKPGYKKMSFDNRTFGKCLNYAACSLKNINNTKVCLEGHYGELCSQCVQNWSRLSLKERCTKCGNTSLTRAIFAAAILIGIFVLSFLVWDNLDGARKMIPSADSEHSTAMPFHTIVIRIVSSYLQVSGMLLRFDLTLPIAVQSLIAAQSGASSVGERLIMFECLTAERGDYQLFMLKQIVLVWLIPLVSIILCSIFWFVLFRRKWSFDGFISSLMVLFYSLFPSIVTRVALTSSCRQYGTRYLLTEALSVTCWSNSHMVLIFTVGIPGLVVFVLFVPFCLARKLIYQRRKHTLYVDQKNYNPRWTLQYGFIFAGYRHGFEWWESIIMMRKCCFVLLSIFLGAFGATAQCVASSMILLVALSAQLHYRPFLDDDHNRIESIGLHACLLQLLVALMGNSVGKIGESQLGPISTAILICSIFGSSLVFFWFTIRATIQSSKNEKGVLGMLARLCGPCCGEKRVTHLSSIQALNKERVTHLSSILAPDKGLRFKTSLQASVTKVQPVSEKKRITPKVRE